jgi:hypothetical protein
MAFVARGLDSSFSLYAAQPGTAPPRVASWRGLVVANIGAVAGLLFEVGKREEEEDVVL